jgi:preprotein translocase subunit SecE
MAEVDDKKEKESEDAIIDAISEPSLADDTAAASEVKPPVVADEESEDEGDALPAAGVLGATRYVMAGFFAAGIACAYVLGRVLATAWNHLAEATWVQKSATFLARVGEEERSEYSTVIGALLAIGVVIYAYRRADVRQWTDEVASELAKVSWPDKSEVSNSTIVVIVTGAFATLYLALLDKFWGFVTNLVYGGSLGT